MKTTAKKNAREETALAPKRAKPILFQMRMTQDTINRLTELAERKGVPTSTLARMWLLERLAAERKVMDPPSKYGEWV